MTEWPLSVREGTGLTERMCAHGVGHPDPDSIEYFRRRLGDARMKALRLDEHGCDTNPDTGKGCCSPPGREPVPEAFLRAWG